VTKFVAVVQMKVMKEVKMMKGYVTLPYLLLNQTSF